MTKQDYGTPDNFFNPLNRHFGFNYDLACTKKNNLCKFGLTPSEDSLSVDWHELEGYLFLNPPFANAAPWARKCHEESLKGAKIVMLTLASVGSKWFSDWVYRKARVRFLTGRLTFKGMAKNPKTGKVDPYNKDLMISIYDNINFGIDVWDWRKGWDT